MAITFNAEYAELDDKDKKALSEVFKRHNINIQQFKLLRDILYPNVQSYKTLVLALDYCAARKLDIFKRTIQIVPIYNSEQRKLVDTIWPSIAEIRITAHRTNQFAGVDLPSFEYDDNGALESCTVTVYRIVRGQKCGFSATVWWDEVVTKTKEGKANSMWAKRPKGQLAKCAEAAALRAAFPEEIGSDYIAEEAFDASAKDVTPRTNVALQEAIQSTPATPVLVEDKTPLDSMFNEVVVKEPVPLNITPKQPEVEFSNLMSGGEIDFIIDSEIYKFGTDEEAEITIIDIMSKLQRMNEVEEAEFARLNRESLIEIVNTTKDKPAAKEQILKLLEKHKELV